ncbi:hypothetical protein JVU11DRAFT_8103 [Chiua virens]|nr:hypothetical protein JVU11DRAFT_8103 [Chiua virens]
MHDARDRLAAKLGEMTGAQMEHPERIHARDMWKRDLADRANGTIDPRYHCDLYDEMIDYAINFTFPWSSGNRFDPYNIPDALSPEALNAAPFSDNPQTRAAIRVVQY